MKKTINFSRWIFLFICLSFFCTNINAQTYTSTYNGVNYSSSRPYNLNIVYFVPNDVPLDPSYKTRLSALMLWGQNFYKQNMIANGYGPKTFGLFTETANPDNVKFIVIHGAYPLASYTYSDRSKMDPEINTYFTNNPSQKNSEHTLIITAVPDPSTANVPFYGLGRACYALDYPQMDIQYLGTTGTYGTLLNNWFGSTLHELGHGLNLAHSTETNTERNDANKGMNLMHYGSLPAFINRAGCATLNTCQVFADTPGTYYNGSTSGLTTLHVAHDNGDLVVSGTFESNIPVTDVNIYQDPYATPSQGYYRVAWSVTPIGNAFSVRMPISDLEFTNQAYNLQVELRLQNGEYQSNYTNYPYSYNNGVPDINIDFGTTSTCVGGTLQLTSRILGSSYQWQYLQNGNWYNYPEGNNGYATFSGTNTSTMSISNIGALYINNPNTVRVYVTRADGGTVLSAPQVWKADGITAQPPALTTACVGGSIQIEAQASGTSYQWQYLNASGGWNNYPEGNLPGYATFTGTKTPKLSISGISNAYVNNPNQARLLVYGGTGCYTVSNTVTWKTDGISVQPAASTEACVGGSLQLSAQASGSSYQWQYLLNGNWYNYPEGNNGHAIFSGSKTPTMTISNISALYVTNPNQARLLVTSTTGCTTTSNTVTWKAEGISDQPVDKTACVGGSLQLTAQASGASYQWQYQNANGTWGNYPEGNVAGYATFSGTNTPTMKISNISANYINGNLARLLVTGSNGCTTASNTVTWKSQNCAARSGKNDLLNIKSNIMEDQTAYPNPVKDELTINLGSAKDNYQVEISNGAGQTIYKTTTSDQTLKVLLSDKPAGIYIVNIKGIKTGSNKSIKIIKK